MRPKVFVTALVVVCSSFLIHKAQCLIDKDGALPIYVFVPLTNDGLTLDFSYTASELNITSPGFSQMAAALMAEQQFNARDPSVVPQLGLLDDCNIKIHISNTSVFDASPDTHKASQALASYPDPAAIVGPSTDLVGLELGNIAQASLFPLVAARIFNMRSSLDRYSNYSASVFLDCVSSSVAITSFLIPDSQGTKRLHCNSLREH
mmetsp:Transcript_11823/g.32795  ORF Transcript_11823/g.32795 Transcript_11823/m.32795 type:complete len:206 (+) Transcript_11823:162-779(+)